MANLRRLIANNFFFFPETFHLSMQIFMDGNSLRRSGKNHTSE